MEIEKVYYKHYRYPSWYPVNLIEIEDLRPYSRRNENWMPSTRGGLTVCHLVLSNDVDIVGTAECSTKDNFCYATGRKIAHGRAMKAYREYVQSKKDYAQAIGMHD